MRRSLQKALKRVRAGHAVDWKSTLASLNRLGVECQLVERAVTAVAYGEGVYKVTIISEEAFCAIETYVQPVDRDSRSAASLSGNTHLVPVKGAMLAVWHAGSDEPALRIFKDDLLMPYPDRKHAFIIENEECFLHKAETYQFAQDHCGVTYSIEDVEFIYGSGNSICNRRIIPYLKNFEGDVLCLLDVDLGGLKIYSNLISAGLEVNRTHFLVPNDITERLLRSKRKASISELEALSQIYGKSELTDRIIVAIRHYKTTIEQESYRADE